MDINIYIWISTNWLPGKPQLFTPESFQENEAAPVNGFRLLEAFFCFHNQKSRWQRLHIMTELLMHCPHFRNFSSTKQYRVFDFQYSEALLRGEYFL